MLKNIFSGTFLCYFQEYPIINFLTKRIKLNLLFKLSNLNSNFALTPGYLNLALNNPALDINCIIKNIYLGFRDKMTMFFYASFHFFRRAPHLTTGQPLTAGHVITTQVTQKKRRDQDKWMRKISLHH